MSQIISQPTSKSHIRVHASGIAALVGQHPYVKQHQAFEELWKKVSPSTYFTALRRHSRESDEERFDRLCSQHASVHVALNHTTQTGNAAASHDVTNILTEAESLVETEFLTSEDIRCIKDHMKKNAFTTYGISKERSVLDILQDELNLKLVQDEKVYAKEFQTKGNVVWRLIGKVDATTEDGKMVIEVKNRVRKLFFKMTEYERIQVECYMRLLNGIEKALLVESIRENEKTTLNIIPVDPDETLWEECIQRAHALIDFLVHVVNDETAQDKYLISKRPSAYLKAQCRGGVQ